MDLTKVIFICMVSVAGNIVNGQDSLPTIPDRHAQAQKEIYGFIRGGIYADIARTDDGKPNVSSAFSDIGLKFGIGNGLNYTAFTDLRFRYGSEFHEPVNALNIREGYVKLYGKKWDISTGQKIIKWGRADFTNPTSRLNPMNYITRSPDKEDMDMGNLLSEVRWYPDELISIEAFLVPFYRSSRLLINPVPLPENITLNQINNLVTDKKMFSYGLKADFHNSGVDWSLSWFDGYDPMPGIALTSFNLDLSGEVPLPVLELTTTPYKIRMAGLDFEFAAGDVGIRGETALSLPYQSYKSLEYVPLPEVKWVAGIDFSSGIFRITGEYSGKAATDFISSSTDPVIGTEPDYAKLAQMLSFPGFDIRGYIRQQVAAFNRLYNYQLEKYYHSGAIRIEADLIYGKLVPSVFTMYNFTSRDLLFIPGLKFKPADGLTLTAGTEIYSGRKGSLFDIVNGFMNSVYVTIRVDF